MPILYLFDIDGTLLRAGGAGARALDAVMVNRYGVPQASIGMRFGGRTDPSIVDELLRAGLGRAPTDGEIDDVLTAYLDILERELASTLRLLPAVHEVLAWLEPRPGVHLGLATGNIKRGARIKLERVGLWDRFRFGGYGCDSAVRAELVARAIERGRELAGGAREVVVVGDTVHDVTAARACGARVVAVTTGTEDPAALAAAGPDIVLDSLAGLPAWHEATLEAAA